MSRSSTSERAVYNGGVAGSSPAATTNFPVPMPDDSSDVTRKGTIQPEESCEAQAGKCLLAGLTDTRSKGGSVAASTLAAGNSIQSAPFHGEPQRRHSKCAIKR